MPGKAKSLKGQFILDSGKLQGSFFHRSVILICQHDAEGAFGLVLNHASEHKLGEALSANLPSALKELPLYHGGPVQQQAMSYLHTDAFLPDANVMANLSLGHSLDSLIELGDSFSAAQRVKVFAGYAGWAPQQLEDEMRRDTWLVHPATLDLVYHAAPGDLWPHLMKQKGGVYRFLADGPEDLAWN